MLEKYHLIIACPDRRGIVAAVSQFIAHHQGLIIEADHHTDQSTQWFFMRYEIDAQSLQLNTEEFTSAFADIAQKFRMEYTVRSNINKPKVVLLASKASHCLLDLLYRWRGGELNADMEAVIANHDILQQHANWYELPFHYVPVEPNQKEHHFAAVKKLLNQYQPDLIVLARYMQILPAQLCEQYQGRIINIHHSFLPSFIGANPYEQAYQHGVKLIGATSHYVTSVLDQGPIIDQGVVRISHRQNLADYICLGRDVERTVLSRAVAAHLDDRVIIHRNKTIVFN